MKKIIPTALLLTIMIYAVFETVAFGLEGLARMSLDGDGYIRCLVLLSAAMIAVLVNERSKQGRWTGPD